MALLKDSLITGDLRVTGTIYGNATSANKLATARTIQTNLASTGSASFNGTGNITPGVSGILGIANGGTGNSSGIPYGFSSRSDNATWGNTTGTTIVTWNDSTGGSIDFRRDNPSGGKMSLKVDGRFYFNEGATPVGGLKNANSYWGMTGPDGEDNIWIRTTSNGLLPYQSGGAGSGHQSLGTSAWYWNSAYIDNIYGALNGNATTATKLASAQSVTLTGDTTGTASSQAGWSIATTTKALTQNGGRISTPNTAHTTADYGKMYHLIVSSAMDASGLKPKFSTNGAAPTTHDGYILDFHWDNNGQYNFQLALNNAENSLSVRSNANSSWQDWTPVLTAKNVVTGDSNGQIKVGGTNVSVKGLGSNAYSSTAYLPLAGGTMTGQIQSNKNGGSWIKGRDNACLYQTLTTSNNWHPVVGFKTPSGSWTMGNVGDNENCVFSYDTDTNFSAGTNSTMQAIYFDSSGYIHANRVYNAVWNDYAEFRKTAEAQPGQCVREVGDGSLVLTTKRLEKGCEIVSDTYGFAIGETDECKTPIATTGRVLAYPYEDIEEFKNHIGDPVCSGPNGTVSIMTEEEEEKYPSRIIGTISEIPTYETWGTGNVKVNGRVWIRIR